MQSSKRIIAVFGIILILIVSFSTFILFFLNQNSNSLEISFTPKSLNTIPGETGWFLVEVDTPQAIQNYDVEITTNVTVSTDYKFWPETSLLEIFVHPSVFHIEQTIEVNVTFSTGLLSGFDTAYVRVWNWSAEGLSHVYEKKDVFIQYIAENHPEFGIDEETDWMASYNSAGILIVGHYLFMSEQWELELDWHVMIEPYDWVRVYLRNRADLQPSWAGEIESWGTDNSTIIEITPPTEIYRPS